MMRKSKLLSLNGQWKYILDKEDSLTFSQVRALNEQGKFGQIKIPSNWFLSEIGDYAGTVWFIKEFELKIDELDLTILQFDGVDYFAEVYLNDFYIGKHEGYFQKFFFDVTNFINDKLNTLIVKVTSPKEDTEFTWPDRKKLIKGIFNHHDCRPGGWDLRFGQDRNTGGIWNDVFIYSYPYVYIFNVKVFSKIFYDKNLAMVDFELSYVLNDKLKTDLKLKSQIIKENKIIWESEFVISKKSDQSIHLIAEIENPALWFPYEMGDPELYEFQILSEDELIFNSTFGIREVELRDHVFYINGKRLFLRGTNIIPEQLLSNLTSNKIKFLVNSLKEANINIVRVHAHINRQELYDAFDKEGILVWQDFALQWTYEESNHFISNAISQIKDMVNQFHHHPSIVFWCCHNEPGEQIKKLDEYLFNAVKLVDNTRIIRKASNYEEHCYEGWYWGKKENYISTPMGPLVTEFGAQALPSKNSLVKFISENLLNKPEDEKWSYHNFQFEQTFHIAKIERGNSIDEFISNSQNYQAELIKEAIHYYRRKKFQGISGIFQFMFIDCWESITWSVIDYFGEKKKGFYALKEAFNPILLSVNLRQDIYSNLSKKLNLEFWIINDLHQEFNNWSVRFYVDEKEIESIPIDKINPDSLIHFSFEEINIKLPEKLSPDFHRLKVELRNHKMEIISAQNFDMEFRNV